MTCRRGPAFCFGRELHDSATGGGSPCLVRAVGVCGAGALPYEREVRRLADIPQSDGSAGLPVEVATLVAEVRVHPGLPGWQLGSIRKVTQHSGFDFRMSASSLSRCIVIGFVRADTTCSSESFKIKSGSRRPPLTRCFVFLVDEACCSRRYGGETADPDGGIPSDQLWKSGAGLRRRGVGGRTRA